MHRILRDLEIQTDYLIPVKKPDLVIINKKGEKRVSCHVDFDVAANHSVKNKKSETIDKYLDYTRELKKQWHIKMTVIPVIVVML